MKWKQNGIYYENATSKSKMSKWNESIHIEGLAFSGKTKLFSEDKRIQPNTAGKVYRDRWENKGKKTQHTENEASKVLWTEIRNYIIQVEGRRYSEEENHSVKLKIYNQNTKRTLLRVRWVKKKKKKKQMHHLWKQVPLCKKKK